MAARKPRRGRKPQFGKKKRILSAATRKKIARSLARKLGPTSDWDDYEPKGRKPAKGSNKSAPKSTSKSKSASKGGSSSGSSAKGTSTRSGTGRHYDDALNLANS